MTLTAITGVIGGAAIAITSGVAMGASIAIVAGPRAGAASALTASVVFALVYFRVLTYPVHVVMAAAAYVVARKRPDRGLAAWRCCSVAWNEMIWLPVPFAGKLLALLVQ